MLPEGPLQEGEVVSLYLVKLKQVQDLPLHVGDLQSTSL